MLNGSVLRDAGVLLSKIPNESRPLRRFEGRIERMVQDDGKKLEIVERLPPGHARSGGGILDGVSKISIEAIHMP